MSKEKEKRCKRTSRCALLIRQVPGQFITKEEEERKKGKLKLSREEEEAAKREKERKAEEAAAAAAAKAQKRPKKPLSARSRIGGLEESFQSEDFNIWSLPRGAAEQERLEQEEAEKEALEPLLEPREANRAKTPAPPLEGTLGEDEEMRLSPIPVSGDRKLALDTEPVEKKELSAVEQRMVYFLERMQVAKDRNGDHPRKSKDKLQYFMPMLFSDDIKYKNFETPIDDEEERLARWKPTDLGKKHTKVANPVNFDVTRRLISCSATSEAVKEHKVKLVRTA